ncbi:MAG: glutamate-1-semialdehyde 2,1-aminomutase [Bradymonadaceae bacterium]
MTSNDSEFSRANSRDAYRRAKEVMPGGVSSPARSYADVDGPPPFVEEARGATIRDIDGNEYVDLVLTWGPAILGHAPPEVVEAAERAVERGSSFGAPTERETEMAELMIDRVPGLDLVRLVNSGTEACMSAIRLARGATGRDKIVKFEGCYHGHGDSFLIAAGSGALTLGTPDSPGVTEGTARDTLLAEYNDLDSVRRLAEEYGDDIAGVILEPVTGNTGCIPPEDGFLAGLREICDTHDILLIFDEVMTGFRVARGGAAERYGIQPDLFCFGKVAGGGFPLAAYGGREEVMREVAPDGPVYQAGTLSGNPVAVAAGVAQLKELDESVYDQLESAGTRLEKGIREVVTDGGYPVSFQRVGSMFSLFFREEPPSDHAEAKESDLDRFGEFFEEMLASGVYMAPSQFEAGFLSTAHDDETIDRVVDAAADALATTFDG